MNIINHHDDFCQVPVSIFGANLGGMRKSRENSSGTLNRKIEGAYMAFSSFSLPPCSECGGSTYHPRAFRCQDCNAFFCERSHCRDAHKVIHEKLKARKEQQARYGENMYEQTQERIYSILCIRCKQPCLTVCERCIRPVCDLCKPEHHQGCKSHARAEFTCRYCGKPLTPASYSPAFCSPDCHDLYGHHGPHFTRDQTAKENSESKPQEQCYNCGIYIWRSITGEDNKHTCGWCFSVLCKGCWASHGHVCPAKPQPMPRFTGRRCEECHAQEFSKTGLRGDFTACPLCRKIICPGCLRKHTFTTHKASEFTSRCKECRSHITRESGKECPYCHQTLCYHCYGGHFEACAAYIKWQCHTCSKYYPGEGPKRCSCCNQQYCHDCYQKHKTSKAGEPDWEELKKEILWKCGECKQKISDPYYTCNNCQGQKFCLKCGDEHHSRVHPHGGFWTHTYGPGERPHTDPFAGFDSMFHGTSQSKEQAGAFTKEDLDELIEKMRRQDAQHAKEQADAERRMWEEAFRRYNQRERTQGTATRNGYIPEKTAAAFRFLRLSARATPDEVKRKRKALAKRYHPDVGGSNDMMKQVNAACDAALEWATAHS